MNALKMGIGRDEIGIQLRKFLLSCVHKTEIYFVGNMGHKTFKGGI